MNVNTLLMDVVNMGMENMKVTFHILDDGFNIPVGHNKDSYHLGFDVRVSLEQKARWVTDSHKIP